MPVDNPDWSQRLISPAISLAAQNVPLNSIVDVFTGDLPQGTHAIKVYLNAGISGAQGSQVTVTDTPLALLVQTWTNPRGPFLFLPVDDITTPTIKVTVTTFATFTCQVKVVAFLSDQAVAVDNNPDAGVPVISAPNPQLKIIGIATSMAAGPALP